MLTLIGFILYLQALSKLEDQILQEEMVYMQKQVKAFMKMSLMNITIRKVLLYSNPVMPKKRNFFFCVLDKVPQYVHSELEN